MRRRKAPLIIVKELDVFPKVSEDYQKSTARGGTLSIISIFLISVLVISEFFYYTSTELKYKYSVDTAMDTLLQFHLDMTVAMSCNYLGADIVDLAGDSKLVTPFMQMEAAAFELPEKKKALFDAKRKLLDLFSESRSLNDFPVIENIQQVSQELAEESHSIEKTGCRIHGKMEVKKVAGNFHITLGRAIPHPAGHAHINIMIPGANVNFSHRIDHLSFGPAVPGGINPLDATLKISKDRNDMFQYFIKIVPTKFSTVERSIDTCQFAVTERNRSISHHRGSHGLSGIFFKFDLNAMSVEIVEERKSFLQFLVRLCGIIGGIFATSGMLHSLIGSMTEGVLCKLLRKESKQDNLKLQNSSEPIQPNLNGNIVPTEKQPET